MDIRHAPIARPTLPPAPILLLVAPVSINTRMDDVTAAKDVHGARNPAITLYHRPLEEHASGGKRNNALNTHVFPSDEQEPPTSLL